MGAGFGIFGKVSVDGSALKQVASQAKAAFAPVGDNIGQQLKGQIMNYLGGAAIAAAVKKTIENATEIRAGANKAETGTDRFQVMKRVADDAGESVDTLVQILKDGGAPAEELAKNLADAEEQMKATGQIIDDQTVQRLAELGDKIKDLMGKLAPFFGSVLDWAQKLYAMGAKGADLATGKATSWIGKIGKLFGISGSENLIQAGQEQFDEAMASHWSSDLTKKSNASIQKAAFDVAAEKEDQERRANLKRLTDDIAKKREDMEKHPSILPVSSLTQAGAIFGPSLRVGGNPQLTESNNLLRQIVRNTEDY